ncbi:hypothetical protein PAXRUDRAFT_115435, partial [Paxillus rubicundulus Ve08.2h10]
YHKWCNKNKSMSMLLEDVQERKLAAMANVKQGTLDKHVQEVTPTEQVVLHLDKLFREATVEWLISTNQPIQAIDHPSFKKMIDVASRATKGV